MSLQSIDNNQIIRMNSVGLSLATIAKELNCHPTTITLRLANMGIAPADTRRAFTEKLYNSLTTEQQVWLVEELFNSKETIDSYLKHLLQDQFYRSLP